MGQKIFNIPGIGYKKEQALIDAGFSSIEDFRNSTIYDIAEIPGFGICTAFNIFQYLGIDVKYPPMKRHTTLMNGPLVIENKKIKPWIDYKKTSSIKTVPDNDDLECTTVWSYPKRGDWATHSPQYRGNWPPQVARNLIRLYSNPGDLVLDPMVGGGTTPVECKLLGRNSISIDINPSAASITLDRLNFVIKGDATTHEVYVGDVRNMNLLESDSVDFIATHPPYANIIHYAPQIRGDLSEISDYKLFFHEFKKAIREMYRVLKPGKYCAVMIGDTHSSGYFVPISAHIMLDFLNSNFILKEDIIKEEWNCESDRYLSKYGDINFLLTMHEHIFVFKKPDSDVKSKTSSIKFFED